MNQNLYDEEFYKDRNKKTYIAATEILKTAQQYINPKSVVDIGGGVGVFLKASQEIFDLSDKDITLVEGDYVPKDLLEISNDRYVSCDLQKSLNGIEYHDLAICLEVAEHLSEDRAESLVKDITDISDVILFSAAYCMQKGDGHINEQRLTYWIDKFKKEGYCAYDVIRPVIQHNRNIPWWYRQNVLLYVKEGTTIDSDIKKRTTYLPPLDMVSFEMVSERVAIYEEMIKNPICRIGYKIQRVLAKRNIN